MRLRVVNYRISTAPPYSKIAKFFVSSLNLRVHLDGTRITYVPIAYPLLSSHRYATIARRARVPGPLNLSPLLPNGS